MRGKKLHILVTTSAAVLILLTGYFYIAYASSPYPEAATIGESNPTFQELSDRFTALAEQKGAVYAYQVEKYADLPPGTDTHLLGHVIGAVLYQQKGVDGIADCTPDFRNACSHQIVIGVMDEFGAGSSTIAMIHGACEKAPGGAIAYDQCYHGLGHGVFAYFGYNIPKAVAFCKQLGTPEHDYQEYSECVGGMIMELIDGGGHDHDQWVSANQEYLNPKDSLSPCDTSLIPYAVKDYCYIYLTPHLFQAAGADLNSPDPSTFPKAFSFCDAISDPKLRDVCYGGFGKEFIPLASSHDIRSVDQFSDPQYSEAISWCMTGTNARAANDCVQEALDSVVWGGENDLHAAIRFCSLVPDSTIQKGCYESTASAISMDRTGDARASLCALLPTSAYQKMCESDTHIQTTQ